MHIDAFSPDSNKHQLWLFLQLLHQFYVCVL